MKRRHYLVDDSVFPIFMTTTITKWIPLFSDSGLAVRALAILEKVREEYKASFIAYVLMPNHIHAIIKTSSKGDLSMIIKRWKALSARLIINFCETSYPDWLAVFGNSAREYKRTPQMNYQVWQPRFDEFAIRTEKQILTKINYIHRNPLKHQVVDRIEDYPYSSVHDYLGAKNRYLKVEPLLL